MSFADAAAKAFSFLLPLGFVMTRRDASFVRFESHNVFVNTYHGRSSYQVGLELGRTHHDELYSLHEVLSAVAPGELERARCQAIEPEVLERCLTAIADSIDRNCRPLLAGDDVAFGHLQSIVSSVREVTTLQAQFGAVIDRADRAWDRKDFQEATDLYEKAVRALDDARMRRLQYLRNRREQK